jgi:hypothetical protein
MCWDMHLWCQFQSFKRDCERVIRHTGESKMDALMRIKAQYESGEKGEKDEFNPWYDVELGLVSYVTVCKDSYKWMLKDEGGRACEGVEEVEKVVDEVGPMI